MAFQAGTSLMLSNTGPSNEGTLYGSLDKAGNINIEAQRSRYDNITAAGNAKQQNGHQFYNTVNNYPATTPYSSVPVKPPEDPIHTDFLRACYEGQGPKRLSFLLNRGANIEHRDQHGNTPLHFAATSGSVFTMKYLIDAGADMYAHEEGVGTPMHKAASSGSTEAMRHLLDAGADINTADPWIGTPLHQAVFSGSADAVRFLLERGADPRGFCKWVGTPLSIAAARKQLALVKIFLEHEIDVNEECGYFGSAAHMACAAGDADILWLLHQGGADFEGFQRTCYAIYRGILDPVCPTIPSLRRLRSLNRETAISCAPVGLAIDHGNIDAASFCLSLTSEWRVNGFYHESWYTDESWRKPSSKTCHTVGLAIAALDIDMLRLLYSNGLGSKRNHVSGNCWMFNLGDVQTHKRPLNGKNASACISLLQEHGAHKKCDCLRRGGDTLLMTIMRRMRRDGDDVSYDIAKAVLEIGVPVNATNHEGQTALMLAAGSDHRSRVRCVELLCEGGAETDLMDRNDRTALRYAEKWGGAEDYEEVKRILQYFGQTKRTTLFSFFGATNGSGETLPTGSDTRTDHEVEGELAMNKPSLNFASQHSRACRRAFEAGFETQLQNGDEGPRGKKRKVS